LTASTLPDRPLRNIETVREQLGDEYRLKRAAELAGMLGAARRGMIAFINNHNCKL
jgi:hypothetical protein